MSWHWLEISICNICAHYHLPTWPIGHAVCFVRPKLQLNFSFLALFFFLHQQNYLPKFFFWTFSAKFSIFFRCFTPVNGQCQETATAATSATDKECLAFFWSFKEGIPSMIEMSKIGKKVKNVYFCLLLHLLLFQYQ